MPNFAGPPLLLALLLALPAGALAGEGQRHGAPRAAAPYAGQETRPIAGLSSEDIAELGRGGGWGLAKPAELNGVPGPAHLLELQDEIALDPDQVAAVEALHARMREQAIAAGARLIAGEAALDAAFRDGMPTPAELGRLLAEIEASRAELRYVHLAAHLETPALLRPEQIARYNELRGYGSGGGANAAGGHGQHRHGAAD